LVASIIGASAASTASARAIRVGDEYGSGHGVVLGLAQQVGSDMYGIGAAVGEHRDLGRAGLGVDPDAAAQKTLGGDDVDVARSGDEVDLAAQPRHAVGEHRDGLGAAHRVHLVDAQQRAQREDVGVRQAAEVLLRRARDGDRRHARGLCRDDVHDHGRGQRCEAARYVQADASHGDQSWLSRSHPVPARGRLRHAASSAHTARRRRIDSSNAARSSGSSSASDCSRTSAGTRSDGGVTPSNFWLYRMSAASPSVATAVQIGSTRATACSTSNSARGTTVA
jgi:hypothetical protein